MSLIRILQHPETQEYILQWFIEAREEKIQALNQVYEHRLLTMEILDKTTIENMRDEYNEARKQIYDDYFKHIEILLHNNSELQKYV